MPHPPENCRAASRCPELFVYLSWRTRDGIPLLADDQTQQAAYQAIGSRTRLQFCRLLAISATSTDIHAVFQFPASLQISHLARISMEAAEEAIARLHGIVHAKTRTSTSAWERDYVLKTLSRDDISQAGDFLQQQMLNADETLFIR